MPSEPHVPASAAPYRLVCQLARGGMGFVEVVVKLDGRFERLYARKRLHPQHHSDARFRAMFLDEARLAGLIRHPNVVSVVDVGEDAEGPFLIMDLVDGQPVARLIARAGERGERLSAQIAVRIGAEAARGLHAAHEARTPEGVSIGLIHRDMSPQNVLVGYDGSVRVTDFGIAKAIGNTNESTAGVLKGTLGYLSPEQLRFEEPDRRSDLFSLGVVLFELLSGTRLYANQDGFDGTRRLLNEPPADIGLWREDLPAELVELMFELMAKDRNTRPPAAQEVATRLDGVLATLIERDGPDDLSEFMRENFAAEEREQKARLTIELDRIRHELTVAAHDAASSRKVSPRLSRRRVALGGLAAALAVALALGIRSGARQRSSIPPAGSAATIALWTGGWHSCGAENDAFFCWGKNNEGQVGDGSLLDAQTRRRVDVDQVVSAALGFFHTCVCTRTGKVSCWGRGNDGQLGLPTRQTSTTPWEVPGIDDCTQVTTGPRHTCALLRNGRVMCWGRNGDGAAGQPPSTAPVQPSLLPTLDQVVQLAAGGHWNDEFTCARRVDGSAWCWGGNSSGALGDGTTNSRHLPRPVPGLKGLVDLAMGGGFGCAVASDGKMWCWGDNSDGQLGTGKLPARQLAPGTVPVLTNVRQVAAGKSFACALRRADPPGDQQEDQVLCWGENNHGQLGFGAETPEPVATPRVVEGLVGVVRLSAGDVHACARHRGGVACWGRNLTAQLGDGTKVNRSRPVSVAGF